MLCDSLEEDKFVITSGEDVREKSASYLIPTTGIEKCEKKKHSLSISVSALSKTAGGRFQTWITWKFKDKYNVACNTKNHSNMAVRDQTFLKIIIKAICSQLIMQL